MELEELEELDELSELDMLGNADARKEGEVRLVERTGARKGARADFLGTAGVATATFTCASNLSHRSYTCFWAT